VTGWRTALRIARRDAFRHRGRSLLVMTLIALPVLAAVSADVVIRSGIATEAETDRSQLADADAWIMAPAGVTDFSQLWSYGSSPPVTGQGAIMQDGRKVVVPVSTFPARPAAQILPLLPAGSKVTAWQHVPAVPFATSSGPYLSVGADLLDITALAAGHRYTLASGKAPAEAGQLAVTTHLARRLGLTVGQRVTAGAPAQHFTITAIVRAAATGGTTAVPPAEFDAIVAMPGTLHFITNTYSGYGPRYLVVSPTPITSAIVATLNGEGIGVYSRADPSRLATVVYTDPNTSMFLVLAGVVIGVVMALLQVVFLAGPAFAIGARRMRRQFGLLVATGATGKHLRAVVLGTGVVLGAAAAALGLLVGVGLGVALRAMLSAWVSGYHSFGLHLHLGELVGIAGFGLGTAVLAALVPAITAGGATPLSLLGRQPSGARPVRWWSLAGAVLAGTGLALTVWMATSPVPQDALAQTTRSRGIGLAFGAALVEIGLLLAIPLLVRILAGLGRHLPTSGRLALRDADRHRSRTAPGIAAVTASATLAVIAAVLFTSTGANAQEHYQAGLPLGDVNVQLGQPADDTAPAGTSATPTIDPAKAEAVVRTQWPQAHSVSYQTVDASQHNDQVVDASGDVEGQFYQRGLIIPPSNLCPYSEPGTETFQLVGDDPAIYTINDNPPQPTDAQIHTAATDWRCYGRTYSTLTEQQAHVHRWPRAVKGYQNGTVLLPTILVGGPELRRQATGVPDPVADAALAAGGAVVLDRTYLAPNGTISSGLQNGDQGPNGPATTDIRAVPAVLGVWSPTPLGVILSPQAAEALGWTPQPGGLVVHPGATVDQSQADDLALALQAATGQPARATVETGSMPNVGDSTRTAMTVVLIILGFLIAGTIIVVTALGLADARADLATLAAVGAAPRVRRLITGCAAGLVTFLGCLLGGAIGLVPAWGLLRLLQIVSAPYGDPIIVPWAVLVPSLIVIPLAAFVIGTLLPRSKLPMVARVE